MIALASLSGSTEMRCSYQPMASASSVSEAIMRAKVRVSALSSAAGSWYWSNPIVSSLVGRASGHCPREGDPDLIAGLEEKETKDRPNAALMPAHRSSG